MVNQVVFIPSADPDMNLERHPLVGLIGYAVSRGVGARVVAVGKARRGILRMDDAAGRGYVKTLVMTVLDSAAVVHLRDAALKGVLGDDLQLRAAEGAIAALVLGNGAAGRAAGIVTLPDDGLLPAAAAPVDDGVLGVDEFGREALAPLDVKFRVLAELRHEIVGEVDPIIPGAVGPGIGRDDELERAAWASRGIERRVKGRGSLAGSDAADVADTTRDIRRRIEAHTPENSRLRAPGREVLAAGWRRRRGRRCARHGD